MPPELVIKIGSPAAAAGEQAPNIDAQLACDAISGWCPA